jgi:hypothetical protein
VSALAHAPHVAPPQGAVETTGLRRPRLVTRLEVAEAPVPATSPWLDRARRLDAMARIGSAFAVNPHDIRHYANLGAMAYKMLAELHGRPQVILPDLYAPTEGSGGGAQWDCPTTRS